MEGLERLFRAVRDRCPADAWSRGVTLSRNGAVRFEAVHELEVQARVEVPGAVIAPKVELYPPRPLDPPEQDPGEWECDCDSPLDACEHVAAVVISLSRGVGTARPEGDIEAPAAIGYRFRRTAAGLYFCRGVEGSEGFEILSAPLEALASKGSAAPRFTASAEDLVVERALQLQGPLEGVIARDRLPRLFAALARSVNVKLDDQPVRVSEKVLAPLVVRVEEDGDGYLLRLHDNPEVEERFGNGCALAAGVLRPLDEPRLSGKERHQLSRGRRYRAIEIAELVGEVLPSLERRCPLDMKTHRLPARTRSRPRLSLRFRDQGGSLYVLATIVYGDPPTARLEGERLVSLGGDVPLRDRDAERELTDRLRRDYGLWLERGEELEAEAAVSFVDRLSNWNGELEGSEHERFHRTAPLTPRWTQSGKSFDVVFEAENENGGKGRAETLTVLGAFREGRSLVPLSGGGFAPLPVDWLSRYGETIADLLASRDARGELPASALPDLGRFCEAVGAPPPPALDRLREILTPTEENVHAELDPHLETNLRSYQRRGVAWLQLMREAEMGALLADDMGLGKTRQALSVLPGRGGRSLVVAPTSVLHTWKTEATAFRPELEISLYHGPDRSLDPEADVTLTSHALLRADRERIASIRWDVIVIDEAQVMKNPDSQIARAVQSTSAPFRLCLSGTPVENRLEELWSQFHFLNPGLLGGLDDFRERYAKPIEAGGTEPLARLRKRIAPFFLRRLKSEVAPELPPRTEQSLRAELDRSERAVYEAIRLATRRDVIQKLDAGGNVIGMLTALLRLRQAACHPALVPGPKVGPGSHSSKTRLLLDSLRTAISDGHKSLVFSQWTSMLDLLEPHLEAEGMAYLRLDGSTKDRASVVEGFQASSGPPVMLISLKAGGTGLNLTAADHVFLFDPWWNPAVEQQAADRAHRIGQEKPVFVYRLVAADTVEERILELQEKKRALSELTIAGGAGAMTKEELLSLLD